MSKIQELFQGSRVLVTGATGFLGQLMIEKLLRTCNNLEMIYVLVRPKKGKSEEERFKQLFDGYLFEPLKQKRPNFQNKVHIISGDLQSPDLGLSNNDRDLLKQNINFIFHIAATVRFDEHIRSAFIINVLATKNLLEIARDAQNLKAFVYISTAYSNCPYRNINECFYESSMKWTEVRDLTNSLDDETLSAITPIIIDKWPNTYTFTKCLAENVIRDLGKDLPVAIVRPSIIVPTANEPIKCWINNIYGAAGIAVGAGLGLIRVARADPNNILDIVPADMVINSSIATAWDIAINKPTDTVILNYVSSTKQPITFVEFMNNLKSAIALPALNCIWYYFLILKSQRLVYNFYAICLHSIPAIIGDTIATILRKQPRLMRGYQKIHKFIDALAYFSVQEWKFTSNNVDTLWNKLDDQDKKLFNFDLCEFEWEVYLYYMLRGMRLYIIGEKYETLEKARVHYFRDVTTALGNWIRLMLAPITGYVYSRSCWSIFERCLRNKIKYTHLVGDSHENTADTELNNRVDITEMQFTVNTSHKGDAVHEILTMTNMELIGLYKKTDTPTYLHYNGSTTNPDLLLAFSDLAAHISQKVLDNPGSSYIPHAISQNKTLPHPSQSNPGTFKKQIGLLSLKPYKRKRKNRHRINFYQYPDKICNQINNVILKNAYL